jgi:hypothetical protein
MYDITKVKEKLNEDDVFNLVEYFGGNPVRKPFGFISDTICHNPRGEGKPKLYYYTNSGFFKCYTGCDEDYFDIFALIVKVFNIQKSKEINLNDAIEFVVEFFSLANVDVADKVFCITEDEKKMKEYEKRRNIGKPKGKEIIYQIYDDSVLDKLLYPRILLWENEGISQDVIEECKIGFYPTAAQITIPHYDYNGNFIGLRGRSIAAEDEKNGKYKPVRIEGKQYNHALGGNLYNLNNSKTNIHRCGVAIVFESEKGCLQYRSAVGAANDISVACCGGSLSNRQYELLKKFGAREIAIAFDKDFTDKTSQEFKKVKKKLVQISNKYKNETIISLVFDKEDKLDYKMSPIDKGIDVFLYLFKNRIIL